MRLLEKGSRGWMVATVTLAVILVVGGFFSFSYGQFLWSEVYEFKLKNQDLLSQVEMQKQDILKAEETQASLRAEITHLENQTFILKNQVGDLKAQVSNLDRDKALLEKESETLKKSLEAAPKVIEVQLGAEEEKLSLTGLRWENVTETLPDTNLTVVVSMNLVGNVTNTGSEPLRKVIVTAAVYNATGEVSFKWVTVENLFTEETNTFTINFDVTVQPAYTKVRAIPIKD